MKIDETNLVEEKKQFKKFAIISITFSIILHFGFLISHVDWSIPKKLTVETKKPEKVRLVFKTRPNKAKQIVNTELKKTKTVPTEAKFLGKQDQAVDRETKAALNGSFKSAGFGVKSGSKESTASVEKSSVGTKKKVDKKSTKKKVAKSKKTKSIRFEDLSLGSLALNEPMAKNSPALGTKVGSKKLKGLASNNDFIEDIPLADMTRLNTVEYKYYGFYFRIRQKLEQHWGDSLRKQAEKMWKSGRRLASDENKITALRITIDQGGNILEVKVKSTSGINELDNAAIESFNRAGPFPNPPSGLIKNGRAQIEWGFVVKS